MNREDKIYSYISSSEYIPLTFDELRVVLDVPDYDLQEFKTIIDTLVCDGKIFVSKKGRYLSCEKNRMITGILHCNARHKCGFVHCDNREDVYIPGECLGNAIDSDSVLLRLTGKNDGRDEGAVVSVLKRGRDKITAVVTEESKAVCDNPVIFQKVLLDNTQNSHKGDRVLVEIKEIAGGVIIGSVLSVLGDSRELRTLAESIICEHNIKQEFDSETISETASLSDEVSKDALSDRQDFTNKTVFTIDGADARDFDDAVSIDVLDNGNYELGVHIADVSHYVTPSTALDLEAQLRGTSVYLPDRVIPMLPERLSNGLCSLNPGVVRLTLSVIMEIDKSGNVAKYRITKGYIRSCARMTYDDCAEILAGNSELCEKYSHIAPDLLKMGKLAKILERRRFSRGSINFEFPENKVVLNGLGRPTEIKQLHRNDAHKLIEEFMLITNETVAEFAYWADLPFVYRVHAQPDADKITALRKFIAGFNIYIKGTEIHPKSLQTILDSVRGTESETIIATYILRSLMKAEYRPQCDGHFGLAAKYYCHFTSPIRRYPDLIIHRIIKEYLAGADVSAYHKTISEISEKSSKAEQTAEYCERDTNDLYKTAYMEDFVGANFPARISSVTNFGMFAELANGVEGLIRPENITDDYYVYDDDKRTLTGRRHGRVYKIGDAVNIEVVRADILSRQIDFVLSGHSPKRKNIKYKSSAHPAKKKYHRTKNYKRGRKNG